MTSYSFSAKGTTPPPNSTGSFGQSKTPIFLATAIAVLVVLLAGQKLAFVCVIAAICGIATLIVRKKKGISKAQQYAPRATTVLSWCNIIFGFALAISASQGTGQLSVTVNADDWQGSSITVHMVGTEESGKEMSDTFTIKPDKTKTLASAKTGTYSFTIDEDDLRVDDVIYKIEGDASNIVFDKQSDMNVTLTIVRDDETTKKLAKQKADEEATAEQAQREKEEAEKQAREEQAAQAAAAAEAENAASEQTPTETTQENTQKTSPTVYVSESGKYHSKKSCSGMKSYQEMTLDEAKSAGYQPCQKCY